MIKITTVRADQLDEHIANMDRETREWTMRAARGEEPWICADCCMVDQAGMPDECAYGDARCTEIIQRDKRVAMAAGNEPF